MEKFNITPLDRLHQELNQRETQILSPLATFSKHAIRRQAEAHLETGYRQAFSVDADRILTPGPIRDISIKHRCFI